MGIVGVAVACEVIFKRPVQTAVFFRTVVFFDKEEIIALTPLWKGDRTDDGRPYVPDKYLKALRSLTLEEIWKPIFVKALIQR